MMGKTKEDITFFVKQRLYVIALLVSAIMSYGYQITHSSLAIDDICVDLYYLDGFGVAIGRWPFFVLRHWFHLDGITNYIPFLVDFFAVILMVLAAVIWSIYIKRIASCYQIRIGVLAYSVFSCLFLSYSLIAQVWIYYLHNGIALGFVLVGISMLLMLSPFEDRSLFQVRYLKAELLSVVLVCIAASFYESLMTVFLFGVCIFLLLAYYRENRLDYKHVFSVIFRAFIVLVLAIILRSCIIRVITNIYGFSYIPRQAQINGIIYTFSNLKSIIGNTVCDYLLLPEYQPIRLFMLCTLFGTIYLLVDAVMKKRVYLLIIGIFSFLSVFSCTLFMSSVLPYRTMQVLSVYVAFCMMIFAQKLCLFYHSNNYVKSIISVVSYIILGITIWNNYCEINYSFYMEYENCAYNMSKISHIGHDLEKMGYNPEDEKVIIIGEATNNMPYPREEDMIIEGTVWDRARKSVGALCNTSGEIRNYYQNVSNDVFNWALNAFGNQQQMVKLFRRVGYNINPYDYNEEILSNIDVSTMPQYPMDGYIKKIGEVYVVNLNH